jgi:PhnB protein
MQLSRSLSPYRALALASVLLACGGSSKKDTAPPEPAPAPVVEPAPVAEAAPVAPIPEGRFTLTPALTVKGVDAAVDFYVAALGAKKVLSVPGANGETEHAEIMVGDSLIMIGEEHLDWGARSPATLGGSPAALMVYVEDADAAFDQAVKAGATAERAPSDMFWGDRWGSFVDPFGHRWSVTTHVEDLTGEQIGQRAAIVDKIKNPVKAAKKWKKITGTPAKDKTPSQYHSVTPVLTAVNADAAIKFYVQAFGAIEVVRMPTAEGKIMHAELMVGDSLLMVHDEFPSMGGKSPKTLGGSPLSLMMYSIDVDIAFTRAINAKASEVMPVADMFWGDRYGAVLDNQGFKWGLATRIEIVTPEQIAERVKAAAAATHAAGNS